MKTSITSELAWRARSACGSIPWLYRGTYGWKASVRRLMVDDGTEIVIEGFPRCANSFAIRVFEAIQGRPVRAAHHLHVIAQFKEGIRRNLPVCALVRPPADAVVSLAILSQGRFSTAMLLRDYSRFHCRAAALADDIVFADFGAVIRSFDTVVEGINRRFDTSFEARQIPREMKDEVFRGMRAFARKINMDSTQISQPTTEKEKIQRELRDMLPEDLLDEANYWYQACLDGPNVVV